MSGWAAAAMMLAMGFGWIKLHYALLYAVVGAYLPYMPIYLNERGFGDWQIGWVLGVYGLAVVVMPILMTHLADRRLSNRALIGMGYSVAAVTLLGVAAVDGFAAMLLFSLLFSLGYTPMFNLIDGMTFSAMHEEEDEGRAPPPYYAVRIWGSVGFMVPAVVLFLLLHWTPLNSTAAIFTASACALLAVATARNLPLARPQTEGETTLPGFEAWRALIRPPVLSLMGPLVLLFLAISIFYAFYSRYLQDLGVGNEWVGIIVNLGVLAEVMLMLASGRLLHVLGIKGLMVLGAVSMVVRLTLLAAVPTVAVAIWTQLLHAPIVLCLYLVPPMYLNLKATRSYRNSMQGLFGVLCLGAARLGGSVIGGYLAEYGLGVAFAAGAAFAAVAVVWLVLGFRDDEACAALRAPHLARLKAPVRGT